MEREALRGGVQRTDLAMNDGRTIRYYDQGEISRSAQDQRPSDAPAGIGELRLDPLVNEWVAVASHRQNRVFNPPKSLCPLCPSTQELHSEIPDSSYNVVVLDNKNPALNQISSAWTLPELNGPDTPAVAGVGKCEVVVFSDQHDGSFGSQSEDRMRLVLLALVDRTEKLKKISNIVQIFPFENRGEEVGVTLSHPHGQIYAYSYLTPRTERMIDAARAHQAKTGKVLFDDIVAKEIADKTRIVSENSHWIAFVPFAARYPYEVIIAPKQSVRDFTELSDLQIDTFPKIAKEIFTRIDGVIGVPMPYMSGWHQATTTTDGDLLRLHLQITCVRPAPGKLKYLAGSESLMGAFVMDKTPESAAEQLRAIKVDLPL